LLCLSFLTLGCTWGRAEEPAESPRLTPLVKVIQSIEPAVVALFTPVGDQIISGSGTIIHEDGYVLTNNHVLPATEGFALLPNSRPIRFRVVGRVPESDIAIIRLITIKTPMAIVPLGRSADLMNGETVVVAGNPGGRGTVYTSGIVSSKSVLEGGPNALVMTNYENSRRDDFIQFDAASNRGNSGGPLVNMDGRVIGIVSAVVNGEQNVGLAIPIDRVLRQFEQMLEPELFHQKSTGLKIQPLASGVIVEAVQEGSAAATAGLLSGDIFSRSMGLLCDMLATGFFPWTSCCPPQSR
jgi:S1-C subfamily serine protease